MRKLKNLILLLAVLFVVPFVLTACDNETAVTNKDKVDDNTTETKTIQSLEWWIDKIVNAENIKITITALNLPYERVEEYSGNIFYQKTVNAYGQEEEIYEQVSDTIGVIWEKTGEEQEWTWAFRINYPMWRREGYEINSKSYLDTTLYDAPIITDTKVTYIALPDFCVGDGDYVVKKFEITRDALTVYGVEDKQNVLEVFEVGTATVTTDGLPSYYTTEIAVDDIVDDELLALVENDKTRLKFVCPDSSDAVSVWSYRDTDTVIGIEVIDNEKIILYRGEETGEYVFETAVLDTGSGDARLGTIIVTVNIADEITVNAVFTAQG